MIPQDYLNLVKSSVNIVDIASDFCFLEERGRDWWGQCPFPDHDDRTPSFSVSPDKGIYKCFGCGRGGGVFRLVQELDGKTFFEAVKYCAEQAGLDFPFEESDEGGNDRVYSLLAHASSEYHRQLKGKEAYFLKERGLSAETVKEFQLGYAKGFHGIATEFYTDDEMDSSGLFKNGRDILRGRYVFPIRNISGKVVAFGGRGVSKNMTAKYVNTENSVVYHKDRTLFGFSHAMPYIREEGFVIVVEGYFDFLSVWQQGFKNCVATCGTAFTKAQASLISRVTRNVVLAFDPDEAGQKAMSVSYASLFEKDVPDVYVMPLEKTDPDDLARKGTEKFRSVLEKSVPFLDWRLPPTKDKLERRKQIFSIAKLAEEVEDKGKRELLLVLCADQLNVPVKSLLNLKISPRTKSGKRIDVDRDELLLISSVINNPKDIHLLDTIPEGFQLKSGLVRSVLEKAYRLSQSENGTFTSALFDSLSEPEARLVTHAESFSLPVSSAVSRIVRKYKSEEEQSLLDELRRSSDPELLQKLVDLKDG